MADAGFQRADVQRLAVRVFTLPQFAGGHAAISDACIHAAKKLAFGRHGFTAATAFNDYFVIAMARNLAALGVRVPADISLVGYDNVEAGELATPAVTILKPAMESVGRFAAELMLKMLDGQSVENVVLDPMLIVRESTGPVRARATLNVADYSS